MAMLLGTRRYFLILFLFTFCTLFSQQLSDKDQQKINEYIQNAERLKTEGDKVKEADLYNKIAYVYWDNRINNEAITYFQKSLELNSQVGNKNAVRVISKNLGLLYTEIENYPEALYFLYKSLEYNKSFKKDSETVADLVAIGAIYSYQQKYDKAIEETLKALELAKEINNINLIKNCYSQLGECYEKQGNSAKSMEYYQLYTTLQKHIQLQELEEINLKKEAAEAELQVQKKELVSAKEEAQTANEQVSEVMQEMSMVEAKNKLLAQENALKEAQIKSNQYRMVIMAIGILFIVIVALTVFVQLRNKKRANELLAKQHEEISIQKTQIQEQHDIVNKQKQKITDSIHYASRIQKAVLPPSELLDSISENYFILFKPRDIVSGDFYWFTQKENLLIIAAADCTGHGVPGAFMSMLGVAFLNEIVNKMAVNQHLTTLQSDEILNQLRENIINSLHQTGDRNEPKDGMDIALCIVDIDNLKLQYSGAHNPLYLLRDGEIQQFNADKMPVSWHERASNQFTRHDIDLKVDDIIYVFSDGFVDQFGGEKGRKYLAKNFRNLLIEIHEKPLADQKVILDQTIEKWRGDREQLDDILVMGLKISKKVKKVISDKPNHWPDKKILIAEDTDMNYFLLVEALRSTSVQTFRAENGLEALNMCQKDDFDLVLMDINMPEMDGHEATRKIKEIKPKLPIIVQTAAFADDEAEKSLQAGADDYVSKPINLKTFIEKIARFLND